MAVPQLSRLNMPTSIQFSFGIAYENASLNWKQTVKLLRDLINAQPMYSLVHSGNKPVGDPLCPADILHLDRFKEFLMKSNHKYLLIFGGIPIQQLSAGPFS